MKVSTKGRYALRTMIDLTVNETGNPIPLKDIANRQNISLKYMEQIISLLIKAKLVKSVRGNNGGYLLAKPSMQYTAGDILRAAEGDMAPIACIENDHSKCKRADYCSVLPFWLGLNKVINGYLDSVTLSELARQAKETNKLFSCKQHEEKAKN
ncbi:Rrf2 family transcriptional regulator [uncultured Megamonas sp.]|uniref:RrF2 family transcriptional regulator n=1 Tax=uncultured Megamonas sp. TaxID=286140 RepID=UPI00266EA1B6|nr:Rrf2 family transcriptional regulator [uncultured Megamonas sp.]